MSTQTGVFLRMTKTIEDKRLIHLAVVLKRALKQKKPTRNKFLNYSKGHTFSTSPKDVYVLMLSIIFLEHTGFFNGNYTSIHGAVFKICDRKLSDRIMCIK